MNKNNRINLYLIYDNKKLITLEDRYAKISKLSLISSNTRKSGIILWKNDKKVYK